MRTVIALGLMCVSAISVSANAGTFKLKSSKGGFDVVTEGTFSSSKACETARKAYLLKNPDRQAVCLKD